MHFGRAELYFPQGEDGTEGETDYDKINDIRSEQERPKTGLEPQFYASAQASAQLAIDVSPSAQIGINVGPSILGKGNLVDAQIIAFVNGTLEFSAKVSASAGTNTDPTFTYRYGAYLYYNLGYGGYANILAGTWNWHYQPVYLYNIPGMRYTIYENDNVESDAPAGSKRSIERLPELQEGHNRAIFINEDDVGHESDNTATVEPYPPPTNPLRHHRHGSRHARFHRGLANATMMDSPEVMVYKREDSDTPMLDAESSSQFWGSQLFKCPAKSSEEVELPELRCECYNTMHQRKLKDYTNIYRQLPRLLLP